MTIVTTTVLTESQPDGIVTVFPYDFYIQNEDQICILIDDILVDENDYQVNGVRQQNGGTVEFNVAPEGDLLVIVRLLDEIQDMQYPEFGSFPAKSHEDALDYLTMLAQQQQFTINDHTTRIQALEAAVFP